MARRRQERIAGESSYGASFAEVRPDANPSKEIFCLLIVLGT
jgi:hypothetical protein